MPNQPLAPPISALSALQLNFLILKLDGQIRVIEKKNMDAILCGKKSGDISFYKKPEGELLMKRFLEAQPIASDVKNTIIEFCENKISNLPKNFVIIFSLKNLSSACLPFKIKEDLPSDVDESISKTKNEFKIK